MEIFMPRLSQDLIESDLEHKLNHAYLEEEAVRRCLFSRGILRDADLPRLDLSDCRLDGCELAGSELRSIAADNIVFKGCDLTACRFDGGFFGKAV
ncbi:MAG: pentapeptide repeat-containing protein, partial [Clostridia bacterium]|nr:pentapeptide repeat-containing protein [Clostridia bacterium]